MLLLFQLCKDGFETSGGDGEFFVEIYWSLCRCGCDLGGGGLVLLALLLAYEFGVVIEYGE